jgi:hypothetical protein
VVEVEDMILGDVGTLYQVPHNPAIVRYPISDTKGAIQTQRRGDTMRLGTYPADALGYYLGISGVTTPQYKLEPAEQVTGTPRLFDYPSLNYGLNLKMALYPGHRINYYFAHYFASFPAAQ